MAGCGPSIDRVPDIRTLPGLTLTGRSFLRELDFTPQEWRSLVDLTLELKAQRREGREVPRLTGRTIALVFEKTSTRTRCAFEVAAYQQGAHVTVLDPSTSQIGHKESVADTARVLGRFYDGIEYRGAAQDTVETLARYAGVPVWNGLTDEWHPTQALCDAVTMLEHVDKPAAEIAFAYVGDAPLQHGELAARPGGADGDGRAHRRAGVRSSRTAAVVEAARAVAAETGARLTVTDDVASGVAGVDVVHTDVWVSMGEPKAVWADRIAQLLPYQVNAALLARTGNPDVRFMHCLPAYHDLGTQIGRDVHAEFGLTALEVTDEVFEGPASVVLDQAENRMHSIKAILVATLT